MPTLKKSAASTSLAAEAAEPGVLPFERAMSAATLGTLPLIELVSAAEALVAGKQANDACTLYRAWLKHTVSPAAHAIHFNLGVVLVNLQDHAGAEASYRQAIGLLPEFVQAYLNLGTVLERTGRVEEAIATWRKALALTDPASPNDRPLRIHACNNLGRVLEMRRQYQEAEAMLTESLMLDAAQPDAAAHWLHLRQKQCKWPALTPINGISKDELLRSASALALLSASDDPALQLASSRAFVAKKVMPPAAPLAPADGYAHKRLRIGYLSSDLCSHAVSILTAELFELHDRSRVEVFAFSWSREDGTPLRARVVKAMDHYIPIHELTDEQAAKLIRSHEIDILVDLHGLTLGTRFNILSYRPAPVQITYLGFPGTTALPCIDYVIADEFLIPPELADFYTEKPLYMPECFQVNDRKRKVGEAPTKAECGLPEDKFIFCSFNNNFKFTPEVFGAWMRVMQRAPDSVLWLVADTEWSQDNLRKQAAAHGIDPQRLIFAGRVAPEQYLARFQVADLFLDTYPFNAGTTASDALWAGLPLLTYTGRAFASRMAGSLLRAAGLPELVAFSLEEYEEKAVALALDRSRVDAMKQHLKETRFTCALFDSPRFVRALEDRFETLAKRPAGAAAINEQPEEPRMQLPKITPMENPARVQNFMVRTVWGLTDPARFYALMDEAMKLVVPGSYLGDNLFTWGRSNSLFEDGPFREAWQNNVQNDADRAIAWRRYILACSAYHCAQLEGDFVECGVYRGTGIKTVIDYFGKDKFTKTYWGYDTFDYNPVQSHKFEGQEDGLFDEIKKRFDGYEQVRLVKGLLPQSLEGNSPEKIAFLHIDLNSAEFEIATLNVLFDRLVPGGMLILDDYEWSGEYRLQKIAEDEWFEKRCYRVFPLPTGQGLVIKR
ncbi:O-linked N-acetylglucosamine transferase family protein [Noviherbaspirillum galbum]|uniref:protein O-GlcNAc transferase n=1 Tax=Noviherbaspirillum galbum TaxID=2709383 RepID=A0A6B3SFM2_9BURK|nr:tetratricopeptide repeat protein [Noviherbaspirillum galbum]NEX59654.1 tetratricopeptide repeat protein [Noviherbaspirillum galbum]